MFNITKSSAFGREMTIITAENAGVAPMYFTAQSFLSDNRRMVVGLFKNYEEEPLACSYHCLDTETGESFPLTGEMRWETGNVSEDDKFYYTDKTKLQVFDLISGKNEELYTLEEGQDFSGSVTITNDCKYLGAYWADTDGITVLGVFDIQNKIMLKTERVPFMGPYSIASHGMLCPVNKDLMFFCHEGRTEYITNRLWLTDFNSKWNLFKQKMDENNNNGECVGHEAWAYDGSGLFFVKYDIPGTLKPNGIYFVDLKGNAKCINSETNHWHVCANRALTHTASDTGSAGTVSKVLLTEIKTGKMQVLNEITRFQNHPGHPHPSFSPDGKKVVYTFEVSPKVTAIGIITI